MSHTNSHSLIEAGWLTCVRDQQVARLSFGSQLLILQTYCLHYLLNPLAN